MAARSTSRPPFAWTEKRFHSKALPYRRQLAAKLQELCRHLAVRDGRGGPVLSHPTQAQAASHLKKDGTSEPQRVSETSLSRYLTGEYLPAADVVKSIFYTAWQ